MRRTQGSSLRCVALRTLQLHLQLAISPTTCPASLFVMLWSLSDCLQCLVGAVSLALVGHRDGATESDVAAYGLANVYVNATGLSVIEGLACAIITLCVCTLVRYSLMINAAMQCGTSLRCQEV